MKMNIHIERLVLEGLPVKGEHKEHILAAVQHEMRQLLAEGPAGDFAVSGAIPALRGGSINVPPNPAPAQLGRQIARAVHQGISK
jgi:hypothetical protein